MKDIASIEFRSSNENRMKELTIEFNPPWFRRLLRIAPKTQTWVSPDLLNWFWKKNAKPVSVKEELMILQALLTFDFTSRNYRDRIRSHDAEI